jgi:hypothetical protein
MGERAGGKQGIDRLLLRRARQERQEENVSQSEEGHAAQAQTGDGHWRWLYRIGAVAPLIALALYASQFLILIFGDPFPTTIESWYALFQRNKLLGLWYLNALDIVSIALLGIMFLALYVALRRVRPSWMLIALYFALLGVVVFVVPRALTLAMAPLSDLHAAATAEAQRTMYLTAGEALSQASTATPQTLGFLLMAVAGLIISVVILRSRSFGRATGFVGIVGFVLALANYITWLIAPSIAAMLVPLNGFAWLVWWLMISTGLFKLARDISDQEADSTIG